MTLSEDSLRRYSRQILLPEIGGKGQERLRDARVLCVGAGGLGSPASLYLAGAGVGTLGIADDESVELSNLHRQILHFTSDVGRPKVTSAKQKLSALNPEITVTAHRLRVDEKEVDAILAGYDLVVDGSDNFSTRYLLNHVCAKRGIPLVSGAVVRWEGLLMTVVPGSACYRCAFPEPPEPGCAQGCAETGILGPAAGVVGSLMAIESIKVLLGRNGILVNRLLTLNFSDMRLREIPLKRIADCPACGKGPASAVVREGARSADSAARCGVS